MSSGDIWSEFENQSLNNRADDNLDFDLDDFLAQHQPNLDFKMDQTDQNFKKVSRVKIDRGPFHKS